MGEHDMHHMNDAMMDTGTVMENHDENDISTHDEVMQRDKGHGMNHDGGLIKPILSPAIFKRHIFDRYDENVFPWRL